MIHYVSLTLQSVSYEPHISEIPIDTGETANKYGVFANNEICLSDIKVYGFDYDYTLASYTDDLHGVLYDLGKEALIKNFKVCGLSIIYLAL